MNTYIETNIFTNTGQLTGIDRDFSIPNIFEVNKEFNIIRRNTIGNSKLDFMKQNGTKHNEPLASEYVEVLLKGNIKCIYRNINEYKLNIGDFVVVEGENCCDIGTIINITEKVDAKVSKCNCSNTKIYDVLRKPDEDELQHYYIKLTEEIEVVAKTKEFVKVYNFDMKVTEANWQFDKQKLTIFFTAPARIDFRELVKDLARSFRTRIELRQISAREEAKRLGDFVGPCGRETCCTTFLSTFNHVTLDHARTQQLSSNVSKLSGNCGRLKCCIKFEYDNYMLAYEKYPPLNSLIESDSGIARIVKVDIFKNMITIHYDGNDKYENITLEFLNGLAAQGRVFQPANQREYNSMDPSLKALEG